MSKPRWFSSLSPRSWDNLYSPSSYSPGKLARTHTYCQKTPTMWSQHYAGNISSLFQWILRSPDNLYSPPPFPDALARTHTHCQKATSIRIHICIHVYTYVYTYTYMYTLHMTYCQKAAATLNVQRSIYSREHHQKVQYLKWVIIRDMTQLMLLFSPLSWKGCW